MGDATQNLAKSLGAGIGGLLNATFGNAAELIIALTMLRQGSQMYPLIKASLTGSMIGNALFILGASFVAGGFLHRRQRFNRTAAGMGATLLALAAVGLIIPAIFYHVARSGKVAGLEPHAVEFLSEEIAVVLAITYLVSLVFTLVTHRDLFGAETTSSNGGARSSQWPQIMKLLVATAVTAWVSHVLVGAIEHARDALGLNELFLGAVVIAVIGNAAEHTTAVVMAVKNEMDATLQITIGSAIQIALFVAPTLVIASLLMGQSPPLDLHFSLMETIVIAVTVVILAIVGQDGESNWLEGVVMLAVYGIIALAFFNLG